MEKDVNEQVNGNKESLSQLVLHQVYGYLEDVFNGQAPPTVFTEIYELSQMLDNNSGDYTTNYPPNRKPFNPFNVTGEAGGEYDFYDHFVNPLSQFGLKYPEYAAILFNEQLNHQVNSNRVRDLLLKFHNNHLDPKEVSELRLYYRLSMQKSIYTSAFADNLTNTEEAGKLYLQAINNFDNIINFAAKQGDLPLLVESLRHSVNTLVSLSRFSKGCKNQDIAASYADKALGRAILATSIVKALRNREDTVWFGRGEVLTLFSIKEIQALVRALDSKGSYVNNRVLLSLLV